jgi:hypothetical protein
MLAGVGDLGLRVDPLFDAVVRIRDATAREAHALEELQRRSSDIWPQYRDERVGFEVVGEEVTRFGPAVRMRRVVGDLDELAAGLEGPGG